MYETLLVSREKGFSTMIPAAGQCLIASSKVVDRPIGVSIPQTSVTREAAAAAELEATRSDFFFCRFVVANRFSRVRTPCGRYAIIFEAITILLRRRRRQQQQQQ